MSYKVNQDKLIIAGLCLVIYFILDFAFMDVLFRNYNEFLRFRQGDTTDWPMFVSYALPLFLTLILIVLPASDLIYSILVVLLVMTIYPSCTLLRYMNTSLPIVTLNAIYFSTVFGFSKLFNKQADVGLIKENQKTPSLLLLSILSITPFVLTFGPHIDLSNLWLSNIYGSRALEVKLSNTYMDYTYSSLANVILPILLVISFIHKEYIKGLLAFVMLIFMFLVGGHKSVFLATLLMVYFFWGTYTQKLKYFLLGVAALLTLTIVSYHLTNNLFLFSLITRRVFFLPAVLDIGYFDYFDGQPIYWSDSILRSYIEYPLGRAPRNLIGEHVLLVEETNANSGIIADGFMNFGIIGALLNIIFVSFIYAILNALNISHRFFGMLFLLVFTFLSTYFFTTMFTHGGLLLIILSYLFLRNTETTYD